MDKRKKWEWLQANMPELARFLLDARRKGLTITNVEIDDGQRSEIARDQRHSGKVR